MELDFETIKECRVCGCSEMTEVIALEPQFLSPTFVETNENNEFATIKVPMTVVVCTNEECNLVQLRETTNPSLLYKNYFYSFLYIIMFKTSFYFKISSLIIRVLVCRNIINKRVFFS